MSGERPWWSHAIQWIIWSIIMTLIMGWLARTRHREPERTSDSVVLRNPKSMLAVGAICSLFFFACSIAAFLTITDGSGTFYLLAFNAFTLLGFPLIADYYKDRFEVHEDRLVFQTTFGGAGSCSWSEVAEVSYSQGMKWFRLVLRNGRVVRVSVMMIGLPSLAERLLTHATAATITEPNRQVLRATASGNPPSVWT